MTELVEFFRVYRGIVRLFSFSEALGADAAEWKVLGSAQIVVAAF